MSPKRFNAYFRDARESFAQLSRIERVVIYIAICAFAIDVGWGAYFYVILMHPSESFPVASAATVLDTRAEPATDRLIRDLAAAGLDPVPAQRITRQRYSGTGRIIALAKDNIQVFEYRDAATASSEALILSQRYADNPMSLSGKKNRYIYANESLIIFYMGENERILQALGRTEGLSLIRPEMPAKVLTQIGI